MTYELYFGVALVYWCLCVLQYRSMVNNDFVLPRFHVRYFSEAELLRWKDTYVDLKDKFNMLSESTIKEISIFTFAVMVLFFSIFWPYYVCKEVVKSFSHK